MRLINNCKSVLTGLLFGLIVPWLKLVIIDGYSLKESIWRCHDHNEFKYFIGSTKMIKESRQYTTDEATTSTTTTTTTNIPPTTANNNTDEWNAGKRIRILCWFMTDPTILNKTRNVKDTWSKQCDVRLFMSSEMNFDFPAVGLDVLPGRNHIAAKSRSSWTYIYKNYFDQADYFMKADPDSYIVMENLKLFLSDRNPDEPEAYGHALYFGHQPWLGNFSGFYTAGQSVVLTRESLKRLVSGGIDEELFKDGQAEDLKTIVCLEKRGGYLVDTRDVLGRETFMPAFGLSSMLAGNFPGWYTGTYRKYLGYCQETECLSHFPIVFHYVTTEMYLIDYLVNGHIQRQQRQEFLEESIKQDFLKFNGSILYHLNENKN